MCKGIKFAISVNLSPWRIGHSKYCITLLWISGHSKKHYFISERNLHTSGREIPRSFRVALSLIFTPSINSVVSILWKQQWNTFTRHNINWKFIGYQYVVDACSLHVGIYCFKQLAYNFKLRQIQSSRNWDNLWYTSLQNITLTMSSDYTPTDFPYNNTNSNAI